MVTINNLIVEVTRKCNMECNHCLRGNAQNINIKHEYIKNFLLNNNIDYVSSVTFTGGEPTLNPDAIKYFLEFCKHHKISIGSFYMVLNGAEAIKKEFVMLLMELYLYCDYDDLTTVEVSNDLYHLAEGQDTLNYELLKCLSFFKEKGDLNYMHVIAEGRGVELCELNGTIDNARIIKPKTYNTFEDLEEIYLNAKGDILTNCNISYKRQNKFKLFNVLEKTFKDIFPNDEDLK